MEEVKKASMQGSAGSVGIVQASQSTLNPNRPREQDAFAVSLSILKDYLKPMKRKRNKKVKSVVTNPRQTLDYFTAFTEVTLSYPIGSKDPDFIITLKENTAVITKKRELPYMINFFDLAGKDIRKIFLLLAGLSSPDKKGRVVANKKK
jgi:hypothetical protein